MYKEKYKFQILASFHLKIIAMITMLFDHIGAYLVPIKSPFYYPMRVIGRIAMPLYAFFIVEGMRYSHNKLKYLLQLFIMGIIVDIGEIIFLKKYSGSIFDTFVISGLIIYFLMKKEIYLKVFALIPFAIGILSGFSFFPIRLEYGPYGMLTVLIIYLGYALIDFYGKLTCTQYDIDYQAYKKSGTFTFYYVLCAALLLIGFNALCVIFQKYLYLYFDASSVDYGIQSFIVFALLLLILYNGKRGYNHPLFKWGCYAFYPVHLIILYIIKLIIG